nr:DUF4179 domain-containing protein [Eubacterium sp. 1001713B170207_170306_E7]
MQALHFSQEAKKRITEKLINTKEQLPARQKKQRAHRFPKLAAAGLAAALVLFVGVNTYGVLDAGEALRGVFGPTANTEIIDKLGRPIGASDTDNGVTITADAIMSDGYNFAITYSIARDDGESFDIDPLERSDGRLDAFFDQASTNLGLFSDAHGGSYFYDVNPNDHTIQYVEKLSYNDLIKPGRTVKVQFSNLTASENTADGSSGYRLIAEGTWNLKFELNFETLSATPQAGQTLTLNGMTGTIDSVMVSPLGYRFEYTLNDPSSFEAAPDGQSPDQHEQEWARFNTSPSIHLADGSVLDLSDGGGSMHTRDGKTVCVRSGVFDEILPLESITSIDIGGVEIPVHP